MAVHTETLYLNKISAIAKSVFHRMLFATIPQAEPQIVNASDAAAERLFAAWGVPEKPELLNTSSETATITPPEQENVVFTPEKPEISS